MMMTMEVSVLTSLSLVVTTLTVGATVNGDTPEALTAVDENGYIVYCPCMGRFGNQADQFLGSLAFAKALNRTLILPPWVEYREGHRKAVMVPFNTYFQVPPLQEYHRVIAMEQFMEELAPTIWPGGQRKVFCYTARHSNKVENNECNAKDGNPFGPFWDWFGIDFDESVVFGPLFYEPSNPRSIKQWNTKYPSEIFPVLAFVGPPSTFPVELVYSSLHEHIKWSDQYDSMAEDFIRENIPERPFVGIHLRNGPDFRKACEHVGQSPGMFAAKQCIGERSQFGPTTYEMCFPSSKTVTKEVKKEVKRIGANTLFIATDFDDLKAEISKELGKKVKIVSLKAPADPMLDLAILGRSDHFIGNCVSTFTAFVRRERDSKGLTTSFWAFDKKKKLKEREEL